MMSSYICRSDLNQTLATNMLASLDNDNMADIWDKMQQSLACCGVVGREDWGDVVPDSCCYRGGMVRWEWF